MTLCARVPSRWDSISFRLPWHYRDCQCPHDGRHAAVSVQRGYDPRPFVLVAFGGAGPLHANALAQASKSQQCCPPQSRDRLGARHVDDRI